MTLATRFRRLAGLLALLLLGVSSALFASELGARDYWVYAGTDTSDFTPRDSEGIYVFKFHAATGKMEPAGIAAERAPLIFSSLRKRWFFTTSFLHGVQNPRILAVHPNGKFLYSADTNPLGTVSAYHIDPNTGKLTLLNVKSSGGDWTTFVTVDHTGKYLLVSNSIGSVGVLPIEPDGRLRDVVSLSAYHGSGEYQSVIPRTHTVNLSRDDRFAVALDTAIGQIMVYRFDAIRGTITPNNPPALKAPRGAGFREMSFHPNGNLCYIIGESSNIGVYRWDAGQGILSPVDTVRALPPDFHGLSAGAEVEVHPSGKFVYASIRGPDNIAVFSVNPFNGTLKPVQFQSSLGQRPRSFGIDPTGRFFFVGNAGDGSLVEFRIDPETGALTPTGASVKAPHVESIRFVPAP